MGSSALIITFLLGLIAQSSPSPSPPSPPPILAPDTVCHSIDVRNEVGKLSYLSNCTVIEGSLQIVLLDNKKQSEYNDLSFPNLREVTDYVLIWRATGLTNIGKLFPNLSVIRGRSLFYNYALAIYAVPHLEQIGLTNLNVIERGGIRIENNPNLCYTDTIDWGRIAIGPNHPEIKIQNNKPKDQCQTCPQTTCPHGVPTVSKMKQIFTNEPLCWNQHTCQRICDEKCGSNACNIHNSTECCDHTCLAGCIGTSNADCMACRNVTHNGKCHKDCQKLGEGETLLTYLDRRCIGWKECTEIKEVKPSTNETIYHKSMSHKCVKECEPGFMEDKKNKFTCIRCINGHCPKMCNGGSVTNLAQIQRLAGCTTITSSLDISLRLHSVSMMNALFTYFKDIETIQGYLKVTKSRAIANLHFFPKLHTIMGIGSNNGDNTLMVFENQNLNDLFDFPPGHQLKIYKKGNVNETGKIFFHNNEKLCFNIIKKMQNYTNIKSWEDSQVSPNSNGDKAACSTLELNFSVDTVFWFGVVISWDNIKKNIADPRQLLGYTIYLREAPENVTKPDFTDCGSSAWTTYDVESGDDSRTSNHIPNLLPATKYAIYIEAAVISRHDYGGDTNIFYFTTDPTTPSPPSGATLSSHEVGTVTVTWKPPLRPNGEVTHYIVKGKFMFDSSSKEASYCQDPSSFRDLDTRVVPSTTPSTPTTTVSPTPNVPDILKDTTLAKYSPEMMSCCKSCSDPRKDPTQREAIVDFEDYLLNNIYVKNPVKVPIQRKRRDVTFAHEHVTNTTEMAVEEVEFPFYKVVEVNDTTSTGLNALFKDVGNYKMLYFEVVACHTISPNLTNRRYPGCSNTTLAGGRSKASLGADNINSSEVEMVVISSNTSTTEVFVSWEDPPYPNGEIVAYNYRISSSSHGNISDCLTQKEYAAKMTDRGIKLIKLVAGDYYFQVQAVSFVGKGEWTSPKSFQVSDPRTVSLMFILIFTSAGIIVLILCSISGTYYFFKIKRENGPQTLEYVSMNPEYMPAYEPDDWEVPREKTHIVSELGQGSFGKVYAGILKDVFPGQAELKCAIKSVNDRTCPKDKVEFLKEASIMKSFKCHHVVRLLGVVSIGNPVYVCMELMENGDLKNYLRRCRDDPETKSSLGKNDPKKPSKPTKQQICLMACQIADGMAYLSAQKFVHRDLAGRNCMVAADLTVKIGDFGMTRDIYETDYYRKGSKDLLPIRWMSPEAIKDGLYTTQSDVWSFGIVLWEMVTLAEQPYCGYSNEQVIKYVLGNHVLAQPSENCPEILYSVMVMCWVWNYKGRPSFMDIIDILYPECQDSDFERHSFYHEEKKAMESASPTQMALGSHETTPFLDPASSSPVRAGINEDDDRRMNYFPTTIGTLNRNSDDEGLGQSVHVGCILGAESNGSNGNNSSNGEGDVKEQGSPPGTLTGDGSSPLLSGMFSIQEAEGSKGSKISHGSNGGIRSAMC